MTICWKKLAPIFAVVGLIGFFPFINELFRPGYLLGIACVSSYPNGRVEEDMGDSCYASTLPKAINCAEISGSPLSEIALSYLSRQPLL